MTRTREEKLQDAPRSMSSLQAKRETQSVSLLRRMELGTAAQFFGYINRHPDDITLDRYQQLCRASQGNPFPLIGWQWPELVVQSDAEEKLFRENLRRVESANVPDALKGVILDPGNPVLKMDWWQHLFLAGLFDVGVAEVFAKGCTGCGKGFSVAIGLNLWYDVYKKSMAFLTAPGHQHTTQGVYGETCMWRRKMRLSMPGKIGARGIQLDERKFITVLSPDPSQEKSGEKFSGHWSPHTLYVFDEASALPRLFVTNARKNATKIISTSNPRYTSGWFYEGFVAMDDPDKTQQFATDDAGLRLCITVGDNDCMNVRYQRIKTPVAPHGGLRVGTTTYSHGERIPQDDFNLAKVLIPGQVDYAKHREKAANPVKGEIAWSVHGKFPDEDVEMQVVPATWVMQHQDYHPDSRFMPSDTEHAAATKELIGQVQVFGLDVARSPKGDDTVLCPAGPGGVPALHKWKFENFDVHVRKVLDIAANCYNIDLTKGRNCVCIDTQEGAGQAVAEALEKLKVFVIRFVSSGRPEIAVESCINRRAEGYYLLGRRLCPYDRWKDEQFALPPDDRLRRELAGPEKIRRGEGRFLITPKDELKAEKFGGVSPDLGDAVVYAHAGLIHQNAWEEYYRESSRPLVWSAIESNSGGGGVVGPHGLPLRTGTWRSGVDGKDGDGDGGGGGAEKQDEPELMTWLRDTYGGEQSHGALSPARQAELEIAIAERNLTEPAAASDNKDSKGEKKRGWQYRVLRQMGAGE